MMGRDFPREAYDIAGWDNPPPLVTYNPCAMRAAWFPLERPELHPQPPGPVMVRIPSPVEGSQAYGDDPTDPARQAAPRWRCSGMLSHPLDGNRYGTTGAYG